MSTISEMIDERRKAERKCWKAFKTFLPSPIGEVIRRSKAKLPRDLVPWAPGVIIPSDRVLLAAGYSPGPGSRRPTGWRRSTDHFFKRSGGCWLIVRKHREFWMIEQNRKLLVFTFGSMPVCTQSFVAAMRLAEYYHPEHRRLEFSLRWVKPDPTGILDC